MSAGSTPAGAGSEENFPKKEAPSGPSLKSRTQGTCLPLQRRLSGSSLGGKPHLRKGSELLPSEAAEGTAARAGGCRHRSRGILGTTGQAWRRGDCNRVTGAALVLGEEGLATRAGQGGGREEGGHITSMLWAAPAGPGKVQGPRTPGGLCKRKTETECRALGLPAVLPWPPIPVLTAIAPAQATSIAPGPLQSFPNWFPASPLSLTHSSHMAAGRIKNVTPTSHSPALTSQ